MNVAAPKSYAPALALGEFCENGATPQELGAPLAALRTAEETSPTAFGGVCGAFGLDSGGVCAFAWCLWRAQKMMPFPTPRDIACLCRRFGGAEPELLFNPASGGLLRAACDIAFENQPRLPKWACLTLPEQQTLFHGRELLEAAEAFLHRCAEKDAALPAALAFTGGPGAGKKFLLGELCRRRGCGLLIADCGALTADNLPELAGLAILCGALVCLDRYDDSRVPLVQDLFQWFSLVLLAGREAVSVPPGCAAFLERKIPSLTQAQRSEALAALFPGAPESEISRASALCSASIGALQRASARAVAEAAAGNPGFMGAALARETGAALSQSAQHLSTNKRLSDLVLPPEQARQLRNLCAFARQRDIVWKDWGFETTIPGGQGLTALFYGASGTGKTLAATIIAGELGLPLYRVDLSQLISKYIGETQKNIGKVFDAAQGADCILFFDEADALFSRRTEAADAQDRYANAEIAYLLQRTEQFDGIILLATNLLQNFDEAFRRRIGFMIRFPVPDEALREKLWRGIFPQRAPLSGIDYPLLAKQLELTGAGIRACALNAARMAAVQGGEITMERLAAAARDEYEKLGKTFPAAFGQRYPGGKEQNG